jgi:hypothetical protein
MHMKRIKNFLTRLLRGNLYPKGTVGHDVQRYLSPEEFAEFKREVEKHWASPNEYLLTKVYKVHGAIISAFAWDDAEKGFSYWSEIDYKYESKREGGQVRR